MKLLCKVVHGSHLYGTNTKDSDLDYKGVYLPSLEDYFLQKVKNTIDKGTSNSNIKNTKDDVDYNIFSINKFIEMCLRGDIVAIDMLHATNENILLSTDVWQDLQSKRHMFYTKNLYSYIGYLKKQVQKYSVKGSKLGDCNILIDYLKSFKPDDLLSNYLNNLPKLKSIDIQLTNDYLLLLEKKFPLNTKLSFVIDALVKFVDKYGDRTKMAENNQGIDYKAISHGFRAGYQLLEICKTRNLVYPLKEKDFLLEVKSGKVDWIKDGIKSKLEDLIDEVFYHYENSDLPDLPSQEYWNKWLVNVIERKTYIN